MGVMEQFGQLGKLLELRGECELFAIVKSVNGLEVVTNTEDYVMQRGMLKVAEEMVMDRQHSLNVMLSQETEREAKSALAAMSGQKVTKGGVN